MDTFPYLDDVTIAGRNRAEHDKNVEAFKEVCKRRKITLNKDKMVIGVKEINILGYRVGAGKIGPDPERLRPLQNMKPPETPRQLKRVKGMLAYYAKWILNFSSKMKPLTQVTRFPISGPALRAFETLKKDLEKVTLNAIDEDKPFQVETDASEVAISASLNQGGRPVAFFFKNVTEISARLPGG